MSKTKILRIYIGEMDKYKNKNLYEHILILAKEHNLKGATVIKGIAGFGANSYIHTTNILRLSEDLPIVIEIIDEEEKINYFLDIIKPILKEGVIALIDLEKSYHFPILAKDIMIKKVISIEETEKLKNILNLILKNKIKFLPVVKNKILKGVITGKDILEKIDIDINLKLTYENLNIKIQSFIEKNNLNLTAKDLMQTELKVGFKHWKIDEVLSFMLKNKLKRLPIVDNDFTLLGLITRTDLLSYLANYKLSQISYSSLNPKGKKLKELIIKNVPTCSLEEEIENIIPKILNSPLKMAVCLNKENKVEGVVFDSELIKYFSKDEDSLLEKIKDLITLDSDKKKDKVKNIIKKDFYYIQEEESLEKVIQIFKNKKIKRLLVFDKDNIFLGIIERDTILNNLLQ